MPQNPSVSRIGAVARYGLLIGPLLSMIDSSIVNVAVPDIATELSTRAHPVQLDQVQWVVSGYLLALGVALAATSYLAKRFGTLRVYTISMVLFVLASAACAIAPNIEFLISVRAAQGFVGAPLVPLALSILLGKDGISGGKIPISAALVLFLGPALGPTLGGFLIEAGGWRWIFLVNVPVGIIGLLLMLRVPKGVGAPANRATSFDPVGFVLLAIGLTGTLFGATEGTANGWDSTTSYLPLGVGAVLLIAYTFWAMHHAEPTVDLRMIEHKTSALALLLQVLCSVISFGTVFLMPVFTQSVQGYSAFETGIALLPQGIIMGLGTWAGQKLSAYISLRVLVVSGFVILVASSVFLVYLEQDTPLWATAAMLAGRAVAIGFVTTPLLVAMLAPLPEEQLADGNTLFNITQRLGGSIGVSILGSLVAGGATLAATIESFHFVGWLLVALAVLSAVVSLWLTGEKTSTTPVVDTVAE